ncbi:glycosyltransferase [Nesterenkonia alba]|uniref:glycosyltransferase n=1 Tax=Nesterenkonia alba TaxID=515814 RepID=UPI0003B4A4C5|nr:glycosyltransferase [Nesterenkonia alba]
MPADVTAGKRVVMLSLHTSPLAQAGAGDAGGLNVYVNALSAALARRGMSVDIVTTDLDGVGPAGDGTDTWRRLPDGRRLHILPVHTTCREDKSRLLECLEDLALRAERSLRTAEGAAVDILHSHYWISGLAGIPLASSLGAQLVHTMHTIGAVKTERDPSAREDPRRHQAEVAITSAASVLTANTRRDAADLQRLFGLGAQKIHHVRPGVDVAVFHPPAGRDPRSESPGVETPPAETPSGQAKKTTKRIRLTFAGRIQAHKGPQIAVAAAGQLQRMLPGHHVELTVAGRQSGPDAVDITSLARAEGIAEFLSVCDPLPHTELAQLFRRSDAVLVPSYSESFGLVALEAMACGTPVIAHDVGGLAEVVDHGSTGVLVDSLDPTVWARAVCEMVTDRRRWQCYSTTAAERARRHSWDATAEAALGAYRKALTASAIC